MSAEKQKVSLPELGQYVRLWGTLVEVQDVTPKEIILDYIFERTDAKLEGRINGKTVKEYGEFNDFYGKGTCIEHAIHEARTQQAYLGESNLEFVVIKVTRRVRMRPDRREREYFYDNKVRNMAELEHGKYWNLPEEIEEVVWSSLSEVNAVK